jgi:uncharacterized protein YcbK (DUF882 family)
VRRFGLWFVPIFVLCSVHAPARADTPPSAAASLVPSPPPAAPLKPPEGEPASVAPSPPPAVSAPPKPVKPKSKKRRPAKPPAPAAELFALNTHETFKLRPDKSGRFGKRELHGWNRFLRCHHTGRTHVMSPRLAGLIYEVAKHFDFKRILVVAGYRAPRVAREKGNPKSPHKAGLACDFRVEGVANTELRDYVRSAFQKVGVGYYPNSEFVHLDVRQKWSAFWIDYSGPGQRARYSKTPEADLEEERTEGPEGPEGPEVGDPQVPPESGASAPAPTLPPAPTQQTP